MPLIMSVTGKKKFPEIRLCILYKGGPVEERLYKKTSQYSKFWKTEKNSS